MPFLASRVHEEGSLNSFPWDFDENLEKLSPHIFLSCSLPRYQLVPGTSLLKDVDYGEVDSPTIR